MGSKSGGNCNGNGGGLNYWRDYFRRANSDIFEIIEHSIMVAASDCPKEFRGRRERIAELLFSCRLSRCLGCDHVELSVSRFDDDGDDVEGENEGFKIKTSEFDDHGGDGSKGSKANSSTRDDNCEVGGELEMNNFPQTNFSFGVAEALTDEIDEEREILGEVSRIKEILHNYQVESDSVLYESLRRLQLMSLTVDILKVTEIGRAVNGIKRHSSKQIRHLARSLIDGWKVLVDEWVKATQEIAAEGGTPDSVNPSTVDEEEGLPSPPLDEGAFFATQTMELSQFFDGMDDDGNPRNFGEFNKNWEFRRKPTVVKPDAPKRREEPPREPMSLTKDNKVLVMRKETITKPNRPSNMQSGPGRPLTVNGEMKVSKDSMIHQKPMKPVMQRRPPPQAENFTSSAEDAIQEKKLEATKRKLQERYQQAELAKRQRTIQVMEIHDLPKQGVVSKNTHGKFGNYNRHWANGRR